MHDTPSTHPYDHENSVRLKGKLQIDLAIHAFSQSNFSQEAQLLRQTLPDNMPRTNKHAVPFVLLSQPFAKIRLVESIHALSGNNPDEKVACDELLRIIE